MAWRRVWFRPGSRPFRRMAGACGLVLAVGLAGCNPIETYRSMSGIAKNDPDPATALYNKNLAAAEAEPYPNLATVPPPPTRETTAAERQKLTQSLLSDRATTAAQAGPPPPTAAAAGAANPPPANPPPASQPPASQPPASQPPTKQPPARIVAAMAAPPAAPGAPPTTPAATGRSAAPGPHKLAPNTTPEHRREPPDVAPRNSTLTIPMIPSLPTPEAARPAPPAPALAAAPMPAPIVEPPPGALASATPEPPPPPPLLAPVMPPPAPAAMRPQTPAETTVATLDLHGTAAARDGRDHAEIERVAALYKEHPGTVRVIAYAAAPAGAGDPLASYHAALDRAQQVAKALAQAGIPARKIHSEATPAAAAKAERIEIQFAP